MGMFDSFCVLSAVPELKPSVHRADVCSVIKHSMDVVEQLAVHLGYERTLDLCECSRAKRRKSRLETCGERKPAKQDARPCRTTAP